MTFKECAEAYMAAHEPSWKNAKHREQWHSTLRRFLYPKFGGVAVSSVTTEMALEAIQPIWHSMPETASRVRGRIEVVIDWAKARGAFSGENPARWRGHLANLLPKPSKVAKVEHHAAVHGFRSTFRDWAAETTSFPNFIVEMALAHAIESKVEGAYRRGDLLEKRRALMMAWSQYCAKAKMRAAVDFSNPLGSRTCGAAR